MTTAPRLASLAGGEQFRWDEVERAWDAKPDDVLSALAREGFEECKREIVRTPGHREPNGGIWQGLNTTTGAVASAVWVREAADGRSRVFVTVGGLPVTG